MFHVERTESRTQAYAGACPREYSGALASRKGAAVTDRRQLRVRFYPTAGKWLCVVQQVGADGMPAGADVVSATGDSKEDARLAAINATSDAEVQQLLRDH